MTALIPHAFRNNLRSPLRIAETVVQAAPGVMQTAQGSVAKRDQAKHPVPATRCNIDLPTHKMFDARVVPLANLKRIPQLQPRATINDVVLAICAGALRGYLSHHSGLPDIEFFIDCLEAPVAELLALLPAYGNASSKPLARQLAKAAPRAKAAVNGKQRPPPE